MAVNKLVIITAQEFRIKFKTYQNDKVELISKKIFS